MSFTLKFITCLILTALIVASVDAAITCGSVASSLTPCLNYLKTGGRVPPACCTGVRKLNSAASTKPDRQQACRCLQSTAKSIPGIKPNLASGLPSKCNVKIAYPIAASTNCNNVK